MDRNSNVTLESILSQCSIRKLSISIAPSGLDGPVYSCDIFPPHCIKIHENSVVLFQGDKLKTKKNLPFQSFLKNLHLRNAMLKVCTLGYQIVVQTRLFFLEEKSHLQKLIRTCKFIDFKDFSHLHVYSGLCFYLIP